MIRYKRLASVALNVTDLDRSRDFYERLVGLQFLARDPDGGLRFLAGEDGTTLALHSGERPGLKRIGWRVESDAVLDAITEALDRQNTPWQTLSPGALPGVTGIAIRTAEPYTGAIFDFFASAEDVSMTPFVPAAAKIQSLGHVVLRTPRYREAVAFCRDALNFKVSDEIDSRIAFMRCFPNPFHHSLAIASGKRTTLHHVNFMVTEIDDIGRALTRFEKYGVPTVFGPGRHPPSGSVFLYFLDPDGLTIEYSFGMEEFADEVHSRAPRRLPAVPESFDTWGNERDPRMSAAGEIETLPNC
jgi:2,3-dihydroxy-p-cumate/2,3-dihydroxybenzoate 3,4-dioxygenase